MASSFDGFSIREYTSKMRSIDVMKCWPFTIYSDEVTPKDVESWLPPMTIPKFRCWSKELELEPSRSNQIREQQQTMSKDEEISTSDSKSVKSDKSVAVEDEKLEMVCPVCRVFNAATLTAVNAHIDGCLAQTMREERRQMRIMNFKSKSKAPKKRSIAEIFEVEDQPQIETVLKFWPFSKDEPDEVSITVTKFRWLSRRLEALRSGKVAGENSKHESESGKSDEQDEKSEMVCPVCRDFNAATVTAVNAHIDGCLAQAMREERSKMRMILKPKPKAPKKRSIAEILTVAPHMEARNNKVIMVEKEEEKRKEVKSDGGVGFSKVDVRAVGSAIKGKKNTSKIRKKKKMKKLKKKSKVEKFGGAMSANNEKRMTMKKKKKKNLFNHEVAVKKEDACKRKLQTPVNTRKLKGTICNKTVALDEINASVHKKKSSLKFLSEEKKQKVKNSDSDEKQQKIVFPHCDLHKNNSKHVSGKTSSSSDSEDGIEASHCDVQVQTSDRNQTFSAEDDILGPKKRDLFEETMFDVPSGALAALVGGKESVSDEEASALDPNRSDGNTTINIEKSDEVCPIFESKQFSNTSEQVTVQNYLKPCTDQEKSNQLVEEIVSLSEEAPCDNKNLHQFDRGNTIAQQFSHYSGISETLSALQEGNISSTQVGDTGKFLDHLEDSDYQVSAMNSNSNMRTFLQPSSSYSASYDKEDGRPSFPSHSYEDNDNDGKALGYRPLPHMFSSEMVDSTLPFPGLGKGSVRNKAMDDNFFGLPLNSHGELINFNSSGKGGMNQTEASSIFRGSSSGIHGNNLVYQNGPEYLSLMERQFVQKTLPKDHVNHFPHYPARLGVTELQGSERADIHKTNSDRCFSHYIRSHDSELNLMNNLTECKRDQVQSHKRNGMILLKESSGLISPRSSQPTMRLMGKDVPIGRSSKEMQQFVKGNIWADEESRRRHYSEDAVPENSLLESCSKRDWIPGSPLQIASENASQSAKVRSNQVFQSSLLTNGPNSEVPQPYLNLQTNHVSQNGSLGVGRNASSYFQPMSHAPTSSAVFNRATCTPERFISGAKHLGLSSQLQVLPTPCNFHQHPCLSNGELNDGKKLPLVAKPSFEFPFLHASIGEHAKTTWFESSSRSLPPWLSSSTQEKPPATSSEQLSGSGSFPHGIWGSNFTTPMNHSEDLLCPPNSLTPHYQLRSPFPASISQPPLGPVTNAIRPSSTMNSGCRNKNKVTDRVHLDDRTIKDHPCNNSRKRPASILDDSSKPIKFTGIEVQERSGGELQRNKKAVEIDMGGDSGKSKCCCQNETQSLNPRCYPGTEFFKLDVGMVISGPVRLSPGAKHILNPPQNTDQDNSRPIHSSIPVAATTTDCGRDLDFQKKMTKIYRF